MWYALYADANISYGGLFWNPDAREYIEVVDLDSAAGVGGANLVARYDGWIDEGRIREAARSHGLEADADRMALALKAWNDVGVFDNLDEHERALLLQAAEAVFRYYGAEGPATDAVLVIDRTMPQASAAGAEWRRTASEWGVAEDEVVLTEDADGTIWRVLHRKGVDPNDMGAPAEWPDWTSARERWPGRGRWPGRSAPPSEPEEWTP